MSFLRDLLAGGPDHRVIADIGGALIAPSDGSDDALLRFQSVVDQLVANDGAGYRVVKRLTHRSSDHAAGYVDRMVINITR